MKSTYESGLTLIDLLITLSVAAIVLTTAVPSYHMIILNNRKAAQVNRFVSTLNLARSEAVKRGLDITICKTIDGMTCYRSSDGKDWSKGWIVFVNSNGDHKRDTEEALLRVFQEEKNVYTWQGNHNFMNYITYRSSGFSNNMGRFTYCDKRGSKFSRAVVINRAGRIRLAQGVCI